MDHFEIIQHPLDRFTLTGSMADLDATGRDSADQLMTMIGDMKFCKGDIRGTCARYFVFIDNAWFCELCLSAHIHSGKLRNYFGGVSMTMEWQTIHLMIGKGPISFPKNEDRSARTFYSAALTQSETLCANSAESESQEAELGPSIQKPARNRSNGTENRQP